MRKAKVFMHNTWAGNLTEDENGYHFEYNSQYLSDSQSKAISATLPLRKDSYSSKTLFSFFDGLIPEGWLLQIAEKNWKLSERDRMGLLLVCCRDCIGAVSIIAEE